MSVEFSSSGIVDGSILSSPEEQIARKMISSLLTNSSKTSITTGDLDFMAAVEIISSSCSNLRSVDDYSSFVVDKANYRVGQFWTSGYSF